MKSKYNSEKDELKLTFTNAEMSMLMDFFTEKYLPIAEDKFFVQQQFSILGTIAKRLRLMVYKCERKKDYMLAITRYEAISLLYVTTNVLNDDAAYPRLISFVSILNDTLYSFVQRMFFNAENTVFSLANEPRQGLPE